MQIQETIVKIQNKGLVTIPKKLRKGFEENGLVRMKRFKGRIILEPARTLSYPVRSYTNTELETFFKLDAKETKELKKEGFL